MALDLEPIELLLKAASIKKVEGAIELDLVLKKGISGNLAHYVVPLADSAGNNVGGMGFIEQSVDDIFAIVVAVRKVGSATGKGANSAITTAVNAVIKALLGKSIDGADGPILLVDGKLLSVVNQTAFWQTRFKTKHYESTAL